MNDSALSRIPDDGSTGPLANVFTPGFRAPPNATYTAGSDEPHYPRRCSAGVSRGRQRQFLADTHRRAHERVDVVFGDGRRQAAHAPWSEVETFEQQAQPLVGGCRSVEPDLEQRRDLV